MKRGIELIRWMGLICCTVITTALLAGPATQADELFVDIDEDRVNFCPAEGEFPAERAAAYIKYQVYELGKIIEALTDEEEARDLAYYQNPVFSPDEQIKLRAVVDSTRFFSLKVLAPVERTERADGTMTDIRGIRVPPPTGDGSKERLQIGFSRLLASMELENAAILFAYNDALREINEWTPGESTIFEKSYHSYPLLLARDQFRKAQSELQSIMIEAIELPTFSSLLKQHVWEVCFE